MLEIMHPIRQFRRPTGAANLKAATAAMLSREQCRLKILDEAFSYLSVQAGAISDLAGNRERWQAAYETQLYETYANIAPFLPKHASRVLDIGSGLGGIDVLLHRHYGSLEQISAIDGANDEPIVKTHGETFSSERVMRQFLHDNGVDGLAYYPPLGLPAPKRFSLIISFVSWCFHVPPGMYLGFVAGCLRLGGILIVDVRRNDVYFQQLAGQLRAVDCILESRKFNRMIYAAF